MANTRIVGCLGAILVHPLLYFLAFVFGFVIGYPEVNVMSATSAYGSTERGLDGGLNAVTELLIIYVFTVGIAALVVSLFGAGIGMALSLFLGRKHQTAKRDVNAN